MPLSLAEVQAEFQLALRDPERPVPAGISGSDGAPDVRRFSVHRNTIMVGLVEVLEQRFPVTRRLVGDDFFRAMARTFAASHMPRSPLLLHYGDELPAFVATFNPARSVPYLADVAALEVAWSYAYHAPEADPLTCDAMRSVSLDALIGSTLTLHPSLRRLRSSYPIGSIWRMHQGEAIVEPPKEWNGEDLLVLRPHAEVAVHGLPPGGYAFVDALASGETIEVAADAAIEEDRCFDIGRGLIDLFRSGGVTRIEPDNQDEGVQ
jgi:hypothetical protein